MKRTHVVILIFLMILIIGHILFFINTINFSVEFHYPFSLNHYFSFLSITFGSFFGIYKWLDLRDLQEEKEKHLGYIRTINDRIGKKIDGNFFTDIKKAKNFCSNKNEHYIIPYGYRYNMSEINFGEIIQEFNKEGEEIRRYSKQESYQKLNNIDEILINLSDEVLDENRSVKNFLEIDSYIDILEKKGKNKFESTELADLEKINERVFIKEGINLYALKKLINDEEDFIVIEGYYYIYKF